MYGKTTLDKIVILEDLGKYYPNNKNKYSRALCFCGKEFITRTHRIKNGQVKSCGCTRYNKHLREFCMNGHPNTPENTKIDTKGNKLCKICEKERYYRNRNTKKSYYQNNKDAVRNKDLERKFSITLADYNQMFDEQKGCCAICGLHQTEFKKRLGVDHDHKTGEVRSLLCTHCNFGLGQFKDDVKLLKKAINYLNKK